MEIFAVRALGTLFVVGSFVHILFRNFFERQQAFSLRGGYPKDDKLEKSVVQVFFSTWFFLLQHVTQQGKWDQSDVLSVWIDVPYVQAHLHRAELLQRCVYCGDYHNKTRRNARCCGANCRSGLSGFINGMVGQPDDEVTRRLSKRLEYIQSKWRKKVRLQLVEN